MKHPHSFVWAFLLSGFAFGAEPESVSPETPWQVSLERTDLVGKVLSQTKVRISVSGNEGSLNGQLMINMAGDSGKRFWTVNFETSPKEGFMTYGITDSDLVEESLTNGDLSVTTVYMCDANLPWKGVGRYPVLVFGKDRLVLEFKPADYSGDSLPTHVAPMWIELTQKNGNGDVLARSSAPWFGINIRTQPKLDLAWPTHIQADSKSEPIARKFRLWEESREGLPSALRVRMHNWRMQTGHLRGRVTYDLLVPLKVADPVMVYEQDGEKVEATIRPPGKSEFTSN